MVIHQHPLRKFEIYQNHPRKKQYVSVVAYFDRHGIINDYVVLDNTLKIDWARVIFQTISLKLLIGSFVGLEGFQRVTIKGEGFKAVVIPVHAGYRAMIYERSTNLDEDHQDLAQNSTLPLVNAY